MGSLRGGKPSRTYWSIQLSYPMQSRLDGSEVRRPLHLSLHRFHAPAPPSLLRVPLGSVPRTRRYYEALRLPAIHPGGLVDSPAGTVLELLWFAPAIGQHSQWRTRVLVSRLPYRFNQDGENRISRVPVRSSRCMPCSHQTPAGPERQAIRRSRCCLPPLTRRRLPRLVDFGAQSHGLHLRCLRFAAAVTRAPRKTRFRLAATLGRAGLDPQDLFGKFPSDSSHVISSPFPELCSAHTTYHLVVFRSREQHVRVPSACMEGTAMPRKPRPFIPQNGAGYGVTQSHLTTP
jgi:hypothetical protein